MNDTTIPREQRIEALSDTIAEFSRQFRRDPAENWPDIELTMPQLRTMLLLSHEAPLRMSDIAGQLGSSLSATTAMVDRLVDKHLVIRTHDTVDRRVVTCSLSPSGEEVLREFWRVQRNEIERTAEFLSDEELDDVLRAMTVLLRAVRQATTVPVKID